MLFFEKSQPAPKCLEKEKRKKDGDYKCGDVLERLKNDFKNKCYICEQKGPLSINVEHFIPHEGKDNDLKFSWENLFWSCAHCNSIKSNKYKNLLNCTNNDDRVEERLKYKIDLHSPEGIEIESLDKEEKTQNTKELLVNVYFGNTIQKQFEAHNLRKRIFKEIIEFHEILLEYIHDDDIEDEYKKNLLSKIKRHLNIESAFVSFKRWMIRDNKNLLNLFEKYLKDN